VTYRDETETLRAQVEKLEGELASANQQVARLRGEAPGSAAGTAGPDKLVGEPLVFDEEHVLPYRLTEQGYEAIAALLKERLAVDVAQVGSTLKGTVRAGVGPTFSLTCEGDTTRVKLRTDLTHAARQHALGGVAGRALRWAASHRHHHGPGAQRHRLASPRAVGGAHAAARRGLGMRKLTAKRAREGRAKHSGTFAALLDVAAQHKRLGAGAERLARACGGGGRERHGGSSRLSAQHEVPVRRGTRRHVLHVTRWRSLFFVVVIVVGDC
jgi:hypothetical protein